METGKFNIRNLVLGSMLFSIGLVLPFVTMQIQTIGKMLLPMHLPVLLSGLVLGPFYGVVIGFLLPLTRSFLFGMPIMMPSAICMAFELSTYGFVSGFLYQSSSQKYMVNVYKAVFPAMIVGRIIWGAVSVVIFGMIGKNFTFQMFISGAFITAIPGVLLQLILIPAIMVALSKGHLIHFVVREKALN